MPYDQVCADSMQSENTRTRITSLSEHEQAGERSARDISFSSFARAFQLGLTPSMSRHSTCSKSLFLLCVSYILAVAKESGSR